MATVRELLDAAADLPGESARRDVEVLLCHCLGKSRAWLYAWPEAEIDAPQQRHYAQMLAQRRAGRPLAYLTGRREFWSLDLAVNDATLIPRPETETLVARALELPLAADAAVLDLGTGSGAIALALASERPGWRVTATDKCPAALAVALRNARDCGLQQRVELLSADWFDGLQGRRFDLVLSNPPYIDPADPHLDRGDLRFEPRGALVAAQGGLADLAGIVRDAPAHLRPGGALWLEHGYQQGEAVRRLLREGGFQQVDSVRDLAGHERISGGVLGAH
ncbi:MAG: protein-(glutamine-N5) methyltransferase, release factor-specific [Halioglobus sp.]|nr:protein-(glutamine-N5) methyltransferase, release factor-specific [Halioglobus sp.]